MDRTILHDAMSRMRTHPSIVPAAAGLVLAATLAGCFPGGGASTPDDPAGFFTGIWHGWIAPLSLIVSVFSDTVRIYEPNNTGWWYDFGFYMAVISGFGGLALSRKRKRHAGGPH